MRSQWRLAGAFVAGALLVTGCGGGGGNDQQAAGGKVDLTFWDWDPNMDKVVDIWNQAHPDIQVTLTNPAGGDQLVSKLITAHEAGNGPDIAKVEYQSLPGAGGQRGGRRHHQYTGDAVKDFDTTTLKVTVRGQGLRRPAGRRPLMFFYRTDIFDQYGLKVPTTWDEYAAAQQLHDKAPGGHMTNFDAADPGWFAGLSQQAGADWWSASGTTWNVAINDAPSPRRSPTTGRAWSHEGVVGQEPIVLAAVEQADERRASSSPGSPARGRPAQLGGIAAQHQGQVGGGAAAGVDRG